MTAAIIFNCRKRRRLAVSHKNPPNTVQLFGGGSSLSGHDAPKATASIQDAFANRSPNIELLVLLLATTRQC